MTQSTTSNRVPSGVPSGGQFAASAKAEALVALTTSEQDDRDWENLHGTAEEIASQVNNGGPEAQCAFLRRHGVTEDEIAAADQDDLDGLVIDVASYAASSAYNDGRDSAALAEALRLDAPAATPVHDLSTLRPDVTAHVALGPGREWGTLCGHDGCDEPVFGTDTGSVVSARARHAFTEHNVHGTVPAQVDEWVASEKHGVRVAFSDLGEGMSGEYDETDSADVPLLRLDIQVRPEHPEAGDEDEDGWHWLSHSAGSMCTLVNAETVTPEQRRRLLNDARAQVVNTVQGGVSISGLDDRLSRMSIADAPA